MKTTLSIPRVALLALALGTASATATFAQSTNTPSTTAPTCSAGKHHHEDSVLTEAEKAQLKTAREAALAANPSLKQQYETLKSEGKSPATKADRKALHAQLRTAELSIDPSLAPIFAKLDAAHKNHSE